jgi:hypothetical protein
MNLIPLAQVEDRAALEEFEATQADDQIGFLRLRNGSYGVMTRYTLARHNLDRNTILLGSIVDAATASRAIATIIAHADFAYALNSNKLDKPAIHLQPGGSRDEICKKLSGQDDMLMWTLWLWGEFCDPKSTEHHIPRVIFQETPLGVARPWRGEYRRQAARLLGPKKADVAEMLSAAKAHWFARYQAIGRAMEQAGPEPTAQQPHGDHEVEGTI